jgi:predicted MFS family arabinose efflux permease
MIGSIKRNANESTRQPSLLTPPVIWFIVCSVTSLASFYLLLSVVPLYVSNGRDGSASAGLAMGVMMLATVLTELIAPGLLTRLGYRPALAAGIVLLGAPILLLPLSHGLPVVLAVCAARGAGLAISVVAGTVLAAALSPDGRRGEMLGLYGMAVSIPSILCLPAGVWLSDHFGFTPVFLISFALAPLALLTIPKLPTLRPETGQNGNVLSSLKSSGVARQALIFMITTIAGGVFVTFLPISVSDDHRGVAAVALLGQAVATTASRWGAGRLGDRFGPARLLVPSMLLAAIGAACLIAIDSPIAVIVGMELFGIGYGAAQNLTLTLMFDRVSRDDFNRVSALWNLAFDSGMGIGAVGFGYITIATGYPWAFAGIAVLLVAAFTLAAYDRRLGRDHHQSVAA